VIVAVGHRFDLALEAWCRSSRHDVQRLLVSDLMRPGWQHFVPSGDHGRAVVNGNVIETSALEMVVTFADGFLPDEVFDIRPEDRAYACLEMNAFLRAWLLSLSCKVLPRPTVEGFRGPNADALLRRGAMLGIDTVPRRFSTSARLGPAFPAETGSVELVHVIGAADLSQSVPPALVASVRETLGLSLGRLSFVRRDGRWLLSDITLSVDLARPEVREALDDFIASTIT
jgi:hypothetical protein